jgi:hypothetical protein
MKKTFPMSAIIIPAILIMVASFFMFGLDSKRPKADHRTLAEKVKSCLGMELTNLQDSLALKPIITGEEPIILTYLLPLGLEAASSSYFPDGLARFRLLQFLDNGNQVENCAVSRETNGTYLVKWNALFASYGLHYLQIKLIFPTRGSYDCAEVSGSKLEETVTNLLQWGYDGTGFGRWSIFEAKIQIPSADYSIFIYDTNTNLVKRIDGHTEAGSIFERWDNHPTNKYAWTDDDLKAEIAITPTTNGADGQIKSNAPTVWFPYPGR